MSSFPADSAFKMKFCVGLKWTQITADKGRLSLCVEIMIDLVLLLFCFTIALLNNSSHHPNWIMFLWSLARPANLLKQWLILCTAKVCFAGQNRRQVTSCDGCWNQCDVEWPLTFSLNPSSVAAAAQVKDDSQIMGRWMLLERRGFVVLWCACDNSLR